MPFTPAHAIVAVPFARSPIPAGALAIGAMAPDLPLFFPGVPAYGLTHGWPSLLWTSVPIALALYAVWRLALRPAASGVLPQRLASRLPAAWDAVPRPTHPVRAALLVLLAIGFGVATHVFWDLFTHTGRLGSQWFPVLARQWGGLDGTTWLQFASSAFGLAGLAAWLVVAFRRAAVAPRDDPAAVGIIRVVAWAAAGAVLTVSFGVQVAFDGIPNGYRALAGTAFDAGTRAGAIILVIALLAALAVRIVRARRGAGS